MQITGDPGSCRLYNITAMSYSYDQIDNIFYNDGYQLAKKLIGNEVSKQKFQLIARELFANIDTLLNAFSLRVKQDKQEIHCKKRCSWCCSQPVFMNDWEAEYLRIFVMKKFTSYRLNEIKEKAENKNNITSRLNPKELLQNRISCPLLVNSECSVYPARPMACRIYLSSNLDSCIYEFNNPSDEKKYAQLYDFPLHAGRKMNEGIAAWLEEHGFEIRELRLEQAVGKW